jgi:hypothetical protein
MKSYVRLLPTMKNVSRVQPGKRRFVVVIYEMGHLQLAILFAVHFREITEQLGHLNDKTK